MDRRVEVERIDDGGDGEHFAVRLEGRAYEVTVSAADRAELAAAASAEALVRESFAFLLEREPPGSILPRFDLGVIQGYFPEYRAEIRRRLGK
jgi:hypothetical protein